MGWFDTFKKDFRIDYVKKILINSREAADAIRHLAEDENLEQNKRGLSDTEYWSILLEYIFLYLHLTDRFAVNYGINEEGRRELIILLADMSINLAVEIVCKELPEDKKENIKEEFKYNLDISLMQYSKFKKEFPEEGGNPQDTLFWEFGKNIEMLSGQRVYEIFFASIDIMINSLVKGKVDIKSFMEKVK